MIRTILIMLVLSRSINAKSDIISNVREFLGPRWLDTLEIMDGDHVGVSRRVAPFWLSGAGCIYVEEYFILLKTNSGLKESGRGSVPFLAADASPKERCPPVDDPAYVKLGISLEDFSKIHGIISDLNMNRLENSKFKVIFNDGKPTLEVRLLDTFYRKNNIEPDHKYIAGSLVDAKGYSYMVELDADCSDMCDIIISRIDVL